MTPDIERMAREAGFRIFGHKIVAADDGISGQATQALERFAALVRAQALSDAAIEAAIHSQYPATTDFDRGYGKGRKDAADKIRALKG